MRINLNDKEHTLCVRISDDMYNSVKEFCDAEMYTLSDFIRVSIDAFFESRNKAIEIKRSISSVRVSYDVEFTDGV